MKKNYVITIPAYQLTQATTTFQEGKDKEIYQSSFIEFPEFKSSDVSSTIDIPLNKALKGSIQFEEDRSFKNGKRYLQTIRLYRQNNKKYSTSIYDSRYAHVKVSQSRLTMTMSISLTDDPERLKARMQNFANIIIEESDEIAAMLHQEGATRVQEAWHTLAKENADTNPLTV